MSQKVLILSPLHQSGATSISVLLAQMLTYNGMTSTLMFTQKNNNCPDYLDIDVKHDPTRSIMQIVRLLDSGELADSEIIDYTNSVAKNCYLLNIVDESLPEETAKNIVTKVYSRITTDIVVCDDSSDLLHERNDALIDAADVIFMVINPSEKHYAYAREWLASLSKEERERTAIVLNYYSEVIDSVRNIAKKLGIPASHLCKLHYNPWITRCCLTGQLQTIIPQVQVADPRVASIYGDMKELIQMVINTRNTRRRKEV